MTIIWHVSLVLTFSIKPYRKFSDENTKASSIKHQALIVT